MDIETAARQVMTHYPQIFLACHTRHRRDPKSKRVISEHQARLLDHLDEIDAIGLNELALHVGVTPATMSLTVDRLERNGYVLRSRDSADHRRVQLRLSPAGARIKEQDSVLDPRRLRSMLARINAIEREKAVGGLRLLASAAKEELKAGSMAGAWYRARKPKRNKGKENR